MTISYLYLSVSSKLITMGTSSIKQNMTIRKRLNLQLTQEQTDYLKSVCWDERTNMNKLIRSYIDEKMDKTKPAQSEVGAGIDNPYDGF